MARCPKCNKVAYLRSDKTISCHSCGYGMLELKKTFFSLVCPECKKVVSYVKADGQAKCKTCGIIKPVKVNNEIASNAMAQG